MALAADLLDVRSQPRELAAAADALLALAKGPGQAAVALDVLSPWLPALAAADNHQALNAVTSRLVALSGRMPAEYAALQPIVKIIRPVGRRRPGRGPRPIVSPLCCGAAARRKTPSCLS